MWSVSEKMAVAPFGETAITFPVTAPSRLNAELFVFRFPGLSDSAPNWLPTYALSPARSKSRELGTLGMEFALPAEALPVAMLYMPVVQVRGGSFWQSTLDARTVAVDVAPVTMPVIGI